MFFVINPTSGSKNGQLIFKKTILPVLKNEDIIHETLITQSSNQLREFFTNKFDRSSINVIAIISGDGTVFQIINSLFQREDWKDCIKIPIMIFPGGTDNGIYTSLFATRNLSGFEHYVKNCISSYKNQKSKALNSMVVEIPDTGKKYYQLLCTSFGIITDIDLQSGKPRWLTIPLTALRLIMTNPYKYDKYTVFFKPVDIKKPRKPFIQKLMVTEEFISGKRDSVEFIEAKKRFGENIPDGWEVVVGNFAAVLVSAHSFIGKISCIMPGFSSFSGSSLLLFIDAESTWGKIKYFLNSENPDIKSMDNIQVIEISSFGIFPPKRLENFTIDGEVFDSQCIWGECSSLNIYE